jgi:Bardet-Biedl syndrome 5 protein
MAELILNATRTLNKYMEAKYKKLSEEAISLWHNKEIRFDVPLMQLGLRRGEILVDYINGVEDTKGNNGERGYLVITNLRLIWYSERQPKTNLSIGYDCISHIEIKLIQSKLRGNVHGLNLRTRFKQTRYEFIFTSLIENSPRLFTSFQATIRSYDTTKLFRDFKIRAAIIQDKELILLPQEQTYHKYTGVWNISAEQGNLGTMYVTNIRLVWFANMAENFNVSLPYVQVKTIKVKESRFGPALILETSTLSGNYILGFRLEGMEEVCGELNRLFRIFIENPVLGVEATLQEVQPALEASRAQRIYDDVEIVEAQYAAQSSASAAYFVSEAAGGAEVVYSPELGLAIERPPNGLSVEQLWRLI